MAAEVAVAAGAQAAAESAFGGGWGNALGMALMGAAGGASGMAGGGKTGDIDHSGWVINFGSGDIDATNQKSAAAALDPYLPYMLIFAGVLVIWRMTKK